MDVTQAINIHNYVSSLRNSSASTKREFAVKEEEISEIALKSTTASEEVKNIWNIVQVSASLVEQISRLCCSCRLSDRIASNLTELNNLKNNLLNKLNDLNFILGIENSENSLISLAQTIQGKIEAIQTTDFPECLDIIVETCQDLLSVPEIDNYELQSQIKDTASQVLTITQSIAQIMHTVDVLAETIA